MLALMENSAQFNKLWTKPQITGPETRNCKELLGSVSSF